MSMIDTPKRVAIIFDHLIHKKSARQIIQDHGTNYSTVRHILMQYYLFGRTDVRKFRAAKNEIEPKESEVETQENSSILSNNTKTT